MEWAEQYRGKKLPTQEVIIILMARIAELEAKIKELEKENGLRLD